MLHCNAHIFLHSWFCQLLQRHHNFAQLILHGNNYATHIHLRFQFGTARRCVLLNHPANMFAMFADDELRHCAWTHPGKRQAKPATKLATAEHHCCSTSLLQLQQQQPLLNVTRRLQHNLKVQSQKSHRFRFGCATKIATALLGNIGGLAKKDDWPMIKW